MGTYEDLKAAIQQVIRTNGNNEITGALLQQTLLSIVNSVGANAAFAGIATPNTNPGTADQNVYYLATEAGTYANFGGIEIAEGEAVILSNKTGNWTKTTSGFATQQQLTKLGANQYELPSCSFEGNGSVFSKGSNFVSGLLPGLPIKLHIEDVAISMEGAESGNRLQVYFVNQKTNIERTVLAILVGQELEPYYILYPQADEKLLIGGRCAIGSTFRVFVEQLTTFQSQGYVNGKRLVNNSGFEYPSEGDAIFGFYRLNGNILSVENVIGSAYTAASVFYDDGFSILGIFNTNNDGIQNIHISYENIIALYPNAKYVRFTSNSPQTFAINSGIDTITIPAELIAKALRTNIVISDTLSNSQHNIFVDVLNKKVVIKKEGFILRAFNKWFILKGDADFEMSFAQSDAPSGAYIIPLNVIANAISQTTIVLSTDIIKYVDRYALEFESGVILFTTYYGNLVAEGLFESAIKVSGKEVLEDAFTGAYIEKDVYPLVNKFCSLFNDTQIIETFCFFTDPHLVGSDNHFVGDEVYTYKYYLGTLQKFYNSSPMDFLVCGGDWLINGDTNEIACYKLGYIDATMRKLFKNYFPVVGNHDYNYLGNNDGVDLTEQTLRNLWMRGEEHTYYEFMGKNTRCFVLDCGIDHEPEMNVFKWEQINWLGGNLKENIEEHIIIFMHIYKQGEPEYITPFAQNIQNLIMAFNYRQSIMMNGMNYDYTNAKGTVHCIIAGHQHEDAIYENEGVPVLTTTNFKLDLPTFDMILIDYNKNKLHSVRVGVGNDREMDLFVL